MAGSPFRPMFVLPRAYAELHRSGVTPGQLRGPRWRQTSRGFYVPVETPESPWQRVANAAVRLPAGAAVGTWAAAGLHGVAWCDGLASDGRSPLPVSLFVGTDNHIRPLGCHVSQEPLPMDETTMLHGVRCTTPTRTCFDGMRLAQDLTEAVVFGDMLLAAGLARLPALCQYVSARRRWRGVPQARAALDLMAADTRGPWESRLRMTWVLEACLPTPLVNVPVFGRDGHLIGIPDLFDPEAAVAWEFDGGGHREARQHADDNVREEKLEDAGILVGRASALDLLHEHRRRDLSQRMRRARVRGLRRNPLADGWTLRTPERHWLGDARGALIEMLLELEPEPHRT